MAAASRVAAEYGVHPSAVDAVAQRCRAGDFDDDDAPARLHGDLWAGNVMWTPDGVVLIDPAAHGGHRENDLAMLALFGCPHYDDIVAGYQRVHPLRHGLAARASDCISFSRCWRTWCCSAAVMPSGPTSAPRPRCQSDAALQSKREWCAGSDQYAGRIRGRRVLRQPRHVRDALRRGIGHRSANARRAGAFRRRRHRSSRRLRPHRRPARPPCCCTWAPVWVTVWPTCTMPVARTSRWWSWSETTPRITRSTTRHWNPTSTRSPAASRDGCTDRPAPPTSLPTRHRRLRSAGPERRSRR